MHKKFVGQFSLISVVVCCLVNNAAAQELMGPPPPPRPSDFSLELALRAAQASLAECDKIDEKVTVAVVDRSEHIRVLLVSDGGYNIDWLHAVQGQARVVLKTGMSSGEYGKSFNGDYGKIADAITADRVQQMKPGATPIPMLVTPGAVPIMKAGVMVGAVSVAGNSPKGTRFGYEYMGPVETCAVAGRNVIEAGIKDKKSN